MKIKFLKIIMVISAALPFVFAALFYIASTPYGENFIRKTLEARLSHSLGMNVEIRSFETNAVSRIHLSSVQAGFTIDNKEYTFLSAGRVRISYRPWQLLRLKPYILAASIDSLHVTAVRDSTGLLVPLKRPEQKTESSGGTNLMVRFGMFDMTHSSVRFDDRTIPLHVLSENISFSMKETETGTNSFHITSDSWNAEYKERDVPIHSLAVRGTLSPDLLSIEQCRLRAGDMACDIVSDIRFGESPVSFDGSIHLNGNTATLKPFFDTIQPENIDITKGDIDADISFSGSPSDPTLTFSASADTITVYEVPCRNITLNGSFTDHTVQVEKLAFSALQGTISGSGTLNADSLFTHDIALELDRIHLDSVWHVFKSSRSPYAGYIDGEIESSGPLRNPLNCSSAADFTLKNVRFRSNAVSDFKCRASFVNNHLTVKVDQPKMDVHADISFTEKAVSGSFGLTTAHPGFLAGFADVFDLNGSLDIRGEISGETARPRITLGFSGQDISYLGFPIDSIHGGITYNDGDVVIGESAFSGTLESFDTLSGRLRVPGLTGGGTYSGSLKGPLDNLDGFIRLNIDSPEYRGFSADRLHVPIVLRKNRIDIENAILTKNMFNVVLDGIYDIPSKKASAVLTLESMQDSSAALSDTTTAPSAGITLHPGNMSIEWTTDENGQIHMKSNGSHISLDTIAQLKTEPLQISGLLDYDALFDGTANAPDMHLEFEITSPAYGRAAFDSMSGTVHMMPNLLVLNDFEIFVGGEKTAAHGTVTLEQPETGLPRIHSDSEINISSEGSNVSIQLLKQFIPGHMVLSGSSNYTLEFGGTLGNPDISGAIAFNQTELIVKPEIPPMLFDIEARLENSALIIENASGSIKDIPFSMTGNLATDNWKEVRTDINMRIQEENVFSGTGTFNKDSVHYQAKIQNFDIGLLQGVVPHVPNLGGRANAELHISGVYTDPQITGSLNMETVSFTPPFFSGPAADGTVSMRFDRKTVSIDSLSMTMGKGGISAKGAMSFDTRSVSDMDIAVSAENLEINRRKDYQFLMDSAGLRLTKQGAYYNLDGEIILGESEFTKDFDIKLLPSFMQKVERPSPEPTEFATLARMDILIRNNENIWIDNNIAHFRIRPDINLIGTLARPNVSGRITAEEGYLIYLDRKFRIQNGVMEFIDPNRVNPIIDLTTTTSVKSYQSLSGTSYAITLSVTGPLDEPVISLTSDPVLDRPDIMALLTIGATRNQITGQSADQEKATLGEVLKERTAALSSRKISGYVTERAGTLLGLEEISIEGNLFNIGKSSGPQLVTSEQINDRLGITYSTAVGHLNDQTIRLDYKLNNHFSLVGETDQKGESALDLKYKLRFK